MADQHRGDVLGCNPHNKGGITPNLDKLCSDGILFTNAHTTTPTCTPARTAILTGRSPWYHGMLGFGTISKKYSFELVHTLNNKSDYFTATFGKNHFGWLNTTVPVLHGYQYHDIYDGGSSGFPNSTKQYDNYDEWFQLELPGVDPMATGGNLVDWNSWRGAPYIYDTYYHPTSYVTDDAINFLKTYDFENGKPLFMKISYHRPHSPYDPPQEYIDYITQHGDMDLIQKMYTGYNWDNKYKSDTPCGPQKVDAWCGEMPSNQTYSSHIDYYSNIYFVDYGIGQIINLLKTLNVYNNTFIIYTADHGDQLGDHYLWRKSYPYQSNHIIPFILKWPNTNHSTFNINDIKIKRGTVNHDYIVELRDLLPTFLNASNYKMNENELDLVNGSNINCLLYYDNVIDANNNCNWREWIDFEHNICYNETNHWNGLTDGRIKYIFNAYFASEQLFNLSNDRYEQYDLTQFLNDTIINETLLLWRNRLIKQFENEDRGEKWVKNGILQQRVQGQLYSPYDPGNKPPIQSTQHF